MKLNQLFQASLDASRNVANFIRHPFQLFAQEAERRAQYATEQIEVPVPGENRSENQEGPVSPQTDRPSASSRSRSVQSAQAQTAVREQPNSDRADSTINFPEPKKELPGRRGKYQIQEQWRSRRPSTVSSPPHRYTGIWNTNNIPVLIKEFPLTDPDHIRQASHELERLESVSLRRTGVQDFRLIAPWDAFVHSEQGYLISRSHLDNEKLVPLREYLYKYLYSRGAMPPEQVRQVLAQVLQTLWFLHTQTIRFSDGTTQRGLDHGNLSLDSLQISQPQQSTDARFSSSFIYLTDLALWEKAFQRPVKKKSAGRQTNVIPSVISNEAILHDLHDLGVIGYQLLVGDADSQADSEVEPEQNPKWAKVPDNDLKAFILNLLNHKFATAQVAYENLLKPPERTQSNAAEATDASEEPATPPLKLLDILPLILFLLLLTGALIGTGMWLFRSLLREVVPEVQQWSQPTAFKSVEDKAFPDGKFTYGVSGIWQDVVAPGRATFGERLTDVWSQRDSRLERYTPNDRLTNRNAILQQIESGQLTFALASWDDELELCKDTQDRNCWVQEPIAYDGIVVFVAFSDPERPRNIPKALGGKISFERLRLLYSGDTDWQIPNGVGGQIKLYVPTDPEVVGLFQRQVLQDEATITKFNESIGKIIWPMDVNQMLGQILQDFEALAPATGIGFARLSKVFGQCSVYPLAIGKAGQEVQPIAQNGNGSITPDTDLCNGKGSYWADASVFNNGSYPLIEKLVVLYYRSDPNSKQEQAAKAFVEAMMTLEGQCLLNEAGLVPRIPVQQTGACRDLEK